jgi:aldose 1-epimerase
VRAENLGAQACPYGVGFHPYLTLGRTIDSARLRLPAERFLLADERAIPVSSEPVAGTPYDFREPREIGSLVLDTCFHELGRDRDGLARVTLADQDAAVTLWLGEAFSHLMIYSGDTLAVERRRQGLAVEPMSCAPNAFAGGPGLVRLEPGATHAAEWGIAP